MINKCISNTIINKTTVTDKHKYVGVVAFDLDGTLIRGVRHSWQFLWKSIGRNPSEAHKNIKDFLNGKIDYKQWVQQDFETFRNSGITLEKLNKTIAQSSSSLTNNLKEALQKLKYSGYVIAIISGGVDSVLKFFLPNPKELFDEIFINKLVWNKNGQLVSIIPTPYDWDDSKLGVLGKCGGLKKICEKYDVPLSDSVFVGDDDNDKGVMKIAGRGIYYNSDNCEKVAMFGDIHYESRNDLMKVTNFILGLPDDDT